MPSQQMTNPYDNIDAGKDPQALPNPYDQFDKGPDLVDRFFLNMEAQNRTGTIQGALQDTARRADRKLFDSRYQALPEWHGMLEGSAALLGQIAGGIWDNENSVPVLENFIPVGVGAKAVGLAGRSMTSIGARVFAGATDAAITNAVADAAIQEIEKNAGFRDQFDTKQWLASTAIGTVAGGVMGPISHRTASPGSQVVDSIHEATKPAPVDPADTFVRPTIDAGHISVTPDTPKMDVTLPEGVKLDFGEAETPSVAKRALMDSESPNDPIALGDRYFPQQRETVAPSETQSMAMNPNAEPLWKNNGTWKETDPDISGVGKLGPVLKPDSYKDNWIGLVDRLKLMNAGEAPEAISHPEIGPIDVIWGDYDPTSQKGLGLKKIVEKHPEVINDLPDIVRSASIITKTDNRIRLASNNRLVVVRLDFDGEAKTWLMTAFEKKDRHIKGSTERLDSRQADAHSSSALPADQRIPEKEVSNKESRRPTDTMARSGDRQVDTSSTSSTNQNMDLEAPEGKLETDLAETIKTQDEEVQPFLSKMRSEMRGDLHRPESGIRPEEAVAVHEKSFNRIKDLTDRLAKTTGVVGVRQKVLKWPGGRSMMNVWGTFHTSTGIIRMRVRDDFKVFAHEVGHHLDKKLGKEFSDLMRLHAIEIEPLKYPGTPVGHELSEGFAEFFRLYMTNPNYVAQEAPRFTKAFTRYLQKNEPDMLKELVALQDAFYEWHRLPSDEAIKRTIVSSKQKPLVGKLLDEVREYGLGNTIADYLHDAYFHMLDARHPIYRLEEALVRAFNDNTGRAIDLKAIDSPYKLARMAEGARSGAHMDILYGVHGYHSLIPGSASLRDAIIKAMGGTSVFSKWNDGRMAGFAAYLKARRILFEWERFENGKIPNEPDKISKGDCQTAISHYEQEFPEFMEAADMVYEWGKASWKLKLDAGLITPEQYRAGLKIRDYVPMKRVMDYPGDVSPKGTNAKGPRGMDARQIDRFVGSMRDTINPLEAMIADMYETRIAIAQNDMIKALDRLAIQAGDNTGAIVERVPAHEMKLLLKTNPVEDMTRGMRQVGYGEPEIQSIRDIFEGTSLEDVQIKHFRPQVTTEKGNVLTFRDGGTLRAIRIADGKKGDQVMKTFLHMQGSERNFWVSMLAFPSRVLRVGVTSAPEFILANIVRDQTMAAIFYGKPFQRVSATASGMRDEFLSRDAARMYNQMGGIMGGENVAALRDSAMKHDLDALRKKGYVAQYLGTKNPIELTKGLMGLTEVSETATRIGLFRSFYDEAKGRGLADYEAAFEAAWRARDHIDFDRHGFQMVGLSRIIPFLNASLQGLDKSVRQMVTPLAKKAMGQILTAEEERALPQAAWAWARLSALITAGTALHALMRQHDEYHELNETTRATHWMVKSGNKWTAIPKPFELAVFLNIGEATWDAVIGQDPTAFERWQAGALQATLPPNLLESNPLLRTYFERKSNKDFFSGADIIPQELQGLEPYLQQTAATSSLSKLLGETLGWSPILADKILVNFGGGLGRSLLSISDLASDKPEQSADNWPFLRRFIKSASKGSRSANKFWEKVSSTTGTWEAASRSYDAIPEGPERENYLASLTEEQRVYIAAKHMEGKASQAKKLHPLDRARRAILAISKLRKDLVDDTVTGAEGDISGLPSIDRGAMVDILASIQVEEARNALVMLNEPGWEKRGIADIESHYRELEALNPKILSVLADRYATAGVVPFETVEKAWPDYRKRLLEDGSAAPMGDFVAMSKHERELNGQRIKRKRKALVPGAED
nr:LPD38 domain-containing protein [uncultured Cohaesibacter sp.]